MKNRNRLIMGTAMGLAAIGVLIDHTRHRLPEAVPASEIQGDAGMYEITPDRTDKSPCSMNSPCSMGNNSPCSLQGSSPCSM